MDALLKALFSQFDSSLDPYGDIDPEKILAAQFGQAGGMSGSAYGMWGSMFGGIVPQYQMPSPLKAFAPTDDPALAALLTGD